MKLAETHYENAETKCCARLDVDLWEGREMVWEDKPFLKDHVRALLHIPLNFGAVITRDHAAIEEAEAYAEEPIWMTDEVSPWRSEIYGAVDREVPGAEIERLSGTFLAKVFEGPYRDAGKWARAMEDFVRSRGHEALKTYTYYATCPKCAKHYGKNQAVLIAQIA